MAESPSQANMGKDNDRVVREKLMDGDPMKFLSSNHLGMILVST